MPIPTRCSNLMVIAVAAILETATFGLRAQAATPGDTPSSVTPSTPSKRSSPQRLSPQVKAPLDRSGEKRLGKASFYHHMFSGRTMANGKRMNPAHNNAASRTLPLGTTAKVTNLETGKSAVVTIQDRGPYVDGRIVDLSPATAQEIGITRRQGVAKVEVSPIAVPLANGRIRLGAAAEEAAWTANNYRSPSSFPPVGW
ncbi:MAG TPA: septal ring lytic transglycosylase RlpA family protein [Steroidobacteraceae bacterium]|nr:septal ring lytic transglycosylase RlpA family protein [Steroidobacteraceae bacterium]